MYSAEAILLHTTPQGEADELAAFYTKEFGKMTIRVRGSKKITTKQGNFLHEPSRVHISFVMSRAGYILSGIKSIQDYRCAGSDLYARGYLMSFLYLCHKLTYEGQRDKALWHVLALALEETEEVARTCQKNTAAVLWQREKVWLLNLLSALGLRPPFLEVRDIKNHKQLDYYLQKVLENKLEQPISFFGLRVNKQAFKHQSS